MTTHSYNYELDPGSKKFKCPKCGQKRFVRYINKYGRYLPMDYGRCDREESCAYFRSPSGNIGSKVYPIPEKLKISTVPSQIMESTLKAYERNTFVRFLGTLPDWDRDIAVSTALRYKLGTSRKGWAIFWQVDQEGKVRTGKMMRYNEDGRRCKEGYSQDWVHTKLRLANFELVQCFFGLHLTGNTGPIGLVESEKTAVIASRYLPEINWIASGGLHGITEFKMRSLAGRKVIMFPDVGAYESWKKKADELSDVFDVTVSDLLERNTNKQHAGLDLADFLVKEAKAQACEHVKNDKNVDSGNLFSFDGLKAANGFNPWTGEVFDHRGYPADWDLIGDTEQVA